MNVKVSIIVPVYNGQDTIKRAIDSILNQTLKEIEIIVINDGSTDETGRLLSQIKDERLKVLEIENGGQGNARNLGIKHASGEFVGFVDADDTIDEKMFEILLSRISDAEVAQCNILNVFPDGKTRIQLSIKDEVVSVTDNVQYFDEYLFGLKHSYESCNKLIRKDFLIANHIEFGNNKEVYSEDLFFNINLAKKLKKIVFIDIPLYHYYQYPNSHSKVNISNRGNNLDRIKKFCRLFEIVYEEKFRYPLSKMAVLAVMLHLSRMDKGYAEILKRDDVRKYVRHSLKSMKKLKQKFVMWSILYLPYFLKEQVIKLYYRNLR